MTLDFQHSFGFRNSRKGVAFYDDNILIFSAGKMCIMLDLDSGIQKQFEFTEYGEISALVKCGVLIAGAVRGNHASVCLLNTLSDSYQSYLAPSSMQSKEFTCLSVSVNLKFVAGQGGLPDRLLVIWLSLTREVAMNFKPASSPEASVLDISFHAAGRDELVVVGKSVFKLYEYQEEEEQASFNEIIFEKFEKLCEYYTIAWPENENLVVGSSEGKMLFFRGIELVFEIIVEDDLKQLKKQDFIKTETHDKAITSIAVTSQNLLCVYAGQAVLVYEGEEMSHYTATKIIILVEDRVAQRVPGELKENPDRLCNITVSPNEKDVVATTEAGQILSCRKFCEGDECQHFSILHHRQHNDSVIGMDVSSGRPLIASCSLHALILWNYSDKNQELRKMFRDKINSVTIHPTGLYVALGFERYCRTFSILYHDLREQKLIPCRTCTQVGYSTGGHLLAIVSNSVIEMHCSLTSSLLFKLDGHAGIVTSFDWIKQDRCLVSCDGRGVICLWNLVSRKKIQENTAIISYSSISACHLTGHFIAMGSERNVRYLDGSLLLLWTFKCRREARCAIFSANGREFLVGTTDGLIEFHSCLQSGEVLSVEAHSGMISGMKYSFGYDILVSSGNDGCIFIWRTPEVNHNSNKDILSKLCLIDRPTLMKLKNKIKQLHLSLHYTDTAINCELELYCVKYEESLRKMAQDHERETEDLNKNIEQLKKEMQIMHLDSDPKNDLKILDHAVRQEIIDTVLKLNEAYKKSDVYANETNKIVFSYENRIDELAEKHSKFSCSESDEIQKISKRIKDLEDRLLSEKQANEQAQLVSERYQKTAEKQLIGETVKLSDSQEALLKSEKLRSLSLEHETEKLKQYIDFKAQEIEYQKNIISGQVDNDITEKIKAITLLKKDFAKLEDVLVLKEKKCQKQEKQFCEMRKLVGSSKKSHSVSKTAIEELMDEINARQSEIRSCLEENKTISTSIPQLEEQIDLAKDLCRTVSEKVGETIDGYQKKEKDLRAMQDTISKYIVLLSQCISKECDPMKLKNDILHLFEENTTASADELANPRLLEEYDFQIDKLKNAYEQIKGEPSKAMREKSMAEFRLSQENSEILRQVRNMQRDAEKLRLIINEMETGLGLQAAQARSSKLAEELRNKIEFVILASRKTKADRMKTIERLDMFIEEQQKEIERFQTMLSAKLRK